MTSVMTSRYDVKPFLLTWYTLDKDTPASFMLMRVKKAALTPLNVDPYNEDHARGLLHAHAREKVHAHVRVSIARACIQLAKVRPGLVATLAKLKRPANHRPLLVRPNPTHQLALSAPCHDASTRPVCCSSLLYSCPGSRPSSSSVSGAIAFSPTLTF